MKYTLVPFILWSFSEGLKNVLLSPRNRFVPSGFNSVAWYVPFMKYPSAPTCKSGCAAISIFTFSKRRLSRFLLGLIRYGTPASKFSTDLKYITIPSMWSNVLNSTFSPPKTSTNCSFATLKGKQIVYHVSSATNDLFNLKCTAVWSYSLILASAPKSVSEISREGTGFMNISIFLM